MRIKGIILYILVYIFALAGLSFSQIPKDIVAIQIEKTNYKVKAGENFKFEISATIKERFHINSNTPNDEFLIPVTITSGNKLFTFSKIEYPYPDKLKLPISDQPISAYEGTIKILVTVSIDKSIGGGKYVVPVQFNYQACDDKTCFPPTTVTKDINVEIISAKTETETIPPVIKDDVKKSGSENDKTPATGTTKNDTVKTETASKDTTAEIVGAPVTTSTEENTSLIIALVFAFIGGIILNLMPCVLPVLSLKIMGFIQQAGEDKSKTRKHGLAFTLGVLVSFWVLAGFLIALRAGGEYLGWGFQLQSPGFVIILSILLFLFGLSMFGVFEIGTTLTSVGHGTANKSSYTGSFSSGVLATIVATPCTAPFMGSALGFALSQPAYVSLLIFTFLGLGMALPYVVLTSTPALLKFVPKPGAWMESFKQFMGFLLMATVLWLLWVLSFQAGSDGVILLLLSLIIVSIGGWIYGRWGNISKKTSTRRIAQILAVIFIIGGIVFSLQNIEAKSENNSGIHKQGSIEWQPYSPELLAQLRSEGKPVFVDFTAAWCLSCQVNEKIAFGSQSVQDAFKNEGVVTLKADWTNSDPVITKALAEFGRNSVPLYVLYYGKSSNKPEILPEILTPGIVLDALKKVN